MRGVKKVSIKLLFLCEYRSTTIDENAFKLDQHALGKRTTDWRFLAAGCGRVFGGVGCGIRANDSVEVSSFSLLP